MSSAGDSPAPADPSPLLTRREAAALCRVSLRTFERFVQPSLPAVAIGARVFFATDDVKQWLNARRRSSSLATPAPVTSRRAHPPGGGALSQQESEILAQLRARRIEALSGAQPKRQGP
jgi:excisionase family DNA binding protein